MEAAIPRFFPQVQIIPVKTTEKLTDYNTDNKSDIKVSIA